MQKCLRPVWIVPIGLAAALAGCGPSAPSGATLSVTCGGTLALAGAKSIDASTPVGGGSAVLSFPDPANPGHIATLNVTAGQPCTIAPVIDAKGG